MLRITPNPFGILQKTILAAAVILSMTLGVAVGDGVEKHLGDYQGSLLMAVGGYETPGSVWGPTEPEYVDTQKKPASESPAKMGVNQYYIFPYGLTHIVMQFHTLRQAQEYTGKGLDEGSGFYYFHARHYDALGGGRFIGEDLVPPDLSNPLTLNPFLYCLNNPGRWVDLDGRVPLLVPLAVAAVAIVMNPTPTDTEGGHAQATKGMVKDIVLSVVGDKAIGAVAGKVARWWGGRAGTVLSSKIPVIREAYEIEVRGLKDLGFRMKANGESAEIIARTLHQSRRDLGVKYKDLTPEPLLTEIYNRNFKLYGDKLGPSIDWLRDQGKSWEDIIEAASRPGGKDLKF